MLSTLAHALGPRKSNSAKAGDEELRKEIDKRTCAKDVVEYIGYDAMYKSGICQVMPRMFSQPLEFSDISYQSGRTDYQKNIFSSLSSIYNYFNADTSVQLTIANIPISEELIGKKKFFSKTGLPTDSLVDEYNRILNDKMREGVSNLERHRYITYSIHANDLEEALPRLTHIKTDISSQLGRIRCNVNALDGTERLRVIDSMVRPKKRFRFEWEKLDVRSGLRTKDFIAPEVLDFSPDNRSDIFSSDGVYGSVLLIRDFGAVLEDSYLASIIDLPMPLSVSIHLVPINQDDALRLVKTQLEWMDKEIIDEQQRASKKGYDYTILPPELRFSKEEAEELLDFLRNKNDRLFKYTGLIYTYASTVEELDHQVSQIISVAQGNSLGVGPLHYRQRQALNSSLTQTSHTPF
ncbi:MAG: hypothetical protein LUB61_00280 [Eggerthellaceae bacterium]|nr:hypothetical protein [Eggerthellaceae bacterium]